MKDLVVKISNIFNEEEIKFIVIGAFARDIYFEEKGIKLEIGTKDIDFAILVESWDEFSKIKDILKEKMEMIQDVSKVYRLNLGNIPIDLIPFGKIAGPGTTIKWPSGFKERMNVLGFKEAYDNSARIAFDGGEVRVVIPEMLVVLKLSSWSHSMNRAKDAMDIRAVLENIQKLCPDLENDFFNIENEELYEKYQNNENGLWISVFGSRIKTLLGDSNTSFYLKNLMDSVVTITSLIQDMNEGEIPSSEKRIELEELLTPFRLGIIR